MISSIVTLSAVIVLTVIITSTFNDVARQIRDERESRRNIETICERYRERT